MHMALQTSRSERTTQRVSKQEILKQTLNQLQINSEFIHLTGILLEDEIIKSKVTPKLRCPLKHFKLLPPDTKVQT